jgi:hypothetical protein
VRISRTRSVVSVSEPNHVSAEEVSLRLDLQALKYAEQLKGANEVEEVCQLRHKLQIEKRSLLATLKASD